MEYKAHNSFSGSPRLVNTQSSDALEILRLSEKLRSTRRRVRFLGAALIVLTAAAVLLLGLRTAPGDKRRLQDTFFPPAEYEGVTFFPIPLYEELTNPVSDAAWAAAIPGPEGFVHIEDYEKYGLPLGVLHNGERKKYGVSWTHQYHCLQMLREHLSKISRNESSIQHSDSHSFDVKHLFHCLDYLRHNVLCSMDTTLEWPTGEPGHTSLEHVNGYRIEHMCKRRDLIYDFMEKNSPM